MTDSTVANARRSIKAGSKSFGLAARLLPPAMSQDCVMLYAWCRHADDVIDGQDAGFAGAGTDATPPAERLQALRDETHCALAGGSAPDVFAGLARVVSRHAIPHRHVDEMLDGFGMDVAGRRYETISDLLDYCYHVAGVVGVMMARIMGATDPGTLDRASDLGIAFQLTNIARDVIDDARIGRVYLPRALLRTQGLEGVDPDNRADRAALHRCALHLLDLAEDYYRSAAVGVAALDRRPAFAIAAAQAIYREIGVILRRRGPDAWDRRISTTTAGKLRLIAGAAPGTLLALRRPVPRFDRSALFRRPA